MKVPVLDLKAEYEELRSEILPALDRVCRNSSFVLGEEVEAFEREFADFCGTKRACRLILMFEIGEYVALCRSGFQSFADRREVGR